MPYWVASHTFQNSKGKERILERGQDKKRPEPISSPGQQLSWQNLSEVIMELWTQPESLELPGEDLDSKL